jgi:hypothetical protein
VVGMGWIAVSRRLARRWWNGCMVSVVGRGTGGVGCSPTVVRTVMVEVGGWQLVI